MIRLVVTRLTVLVASYAIQRAGHAPFVTLRTEEAKAELGRQGIVDAERYLAHAEWGFVEIVGESDGQ